MPPNSGPPGDAACPEGAAPEGAGPEGKRGAAADDPVALYDPRRFAFFRLMFARTARIHTRGIRVPDWGMPAPVPEGAPLLVLANHPSWWDGVSFMLLAPALFPARRMFIPMEAAALRRYGFMRRIGVFGVENGTPRGAAGFLRTARRVLASPGAMLWMNAPGRFQDARERPVHLAPGVSRLPELAPGLRVLPLALEYPFWSERRPEMLAAFGAPVEGASLLALDRPARTEALRAALTATMDRLAADAVSRDESRFRTLHRGREGMGGIYDAWRRVRALARGERFEPRHGG